MKSNNWLSEIDSSWTLFLDRDGVINQRNFEGYIERVTDFIFMDGVLESLKYFTTIFQRIIVVTNQQGVGKGLMTSGQLSLIHEHMLNKVQAFNGRIDAVFAATSLKSSELKERKPHPFMALQAKNKFPEIDFHKSIMVGDTDSDVQFGKNLGMKTVLIRSKEVISSSPDVVLESLDQLVF